jgi:pilus assembly protein FimV
VPAAAPTQEAKVQEVTPQPAPVTPAPVAAPPKAEPTKATPPPPPPASASFIEELLASPTTQIGLGILVAALLGLFGYNIYRRRRVEKTEEFQATGTGLRANSLFGSTGGQSVDTGATSTFNSSFIPAASQLDSNEVDPIAEADVYIAYGREEQAEDILKEALRLQPDRNSVRVKLLEIYSRRGDKASFNAMIDELRSRTGGAGEEWERAAKLGRAFDPSNSAFAAAAGAAETTFRGPTTELRLEPGTGSSRAGTLGGMTLPPSTTTFGGGGREEPVFDLNTSALPTSAESAPETKMSVDTVMQPDTRLTAETRMPADTRSSPPTTQAGPSTRFEATLPTEEAAAPTRPPATARAGTIDPFGATTSGAIDFSALDFDLGGPRTTPPAPAPAPEEFDFSLSPPPPPAIPPSPPSPAPVPPPQAPAGANIRPPATAVGRGEIPEVDLTLPNTTAPSPARPAPAPVSPPPAEPTSFEESLSRPTLLGAVGALPDEQAPRLTSNTDQATVPLIDFDLGGPEAEIGGRRTETQAGSPMAAQMATKLDLARGYIDLGVKDGARELLEEVMREGTREQRQSAVELMKAVEV